MKKLLWKLFYLVFFVVIIGGVGYGVYHYFYAPNSSRIISPKAQQEINNEYLDTLVLDIQTNLKGIKVQTDNISKSLSGVATIVSVLAVLVVVNLLLILLLALLIFYWHSRMKKKYLKMQESKGNI